MEKQEGKTQTRSNLFYVVVFIVTVFILSILSLSYKFVSLLNSSTFKTPSMNILVIEKNAHVIHVDRTSREMAIFTIKDAGSEINNLTNLGASLTFRVPIDAKVVYSGSPDIDKNFFTFKRAIVSLFNATGATYTNMNSADILKMYLATRGIEEERRYQITKDKSYLKDSAKNVDEDLSEYFKDETIFNEKVSVEVINATQIGGFGSRVARMLENVGYDVVSVKNGTYTSSSIINRGKPNTKTLEYLSRFLKFKVTSDNSPPVADISIIFGQPQ